MAEKQWCVQNQELKGGKAPEIALTVSTGIPTGNGPRKFGEPDTRTLLLVLGCAPLEKPKR